MHSFSRVKRYHKALMCKPHFVGQILGIKIEGEAYPQDHLHWELVHGFGL